MYIKHGIYIILLLIEMAKNQVKAFSKSKKTEAQLHAELSAAHASVRALTAELRERFNYRSEVSAPNTPRHQNAEDEAWHKEELEALHEKAVYNRG